MGVQSWRGDGSVARGVGGTSVAVGSGGASSGASSGSSSSRGGERDVRAVEARLTGQSVRVTARITDDTADCVGHAYGRVRDFLRERPCVALRRAQLEVRLPAGDVVLVAVSWVEMPDEDGARDRRASGLALTALVNEAVR